jgi:hypothetical protein
MHFSQRQVHDSQKRIQPKEEGRSAVNKDLGVAKDPRKWLSMLNCMDIA